MKSLLLFILFFLLNITAYAIPLQIAAIDISNVSKKQTSQKAENIPAKKQQIKPKVTINKSKIQAIEGYRTSYDKKGNQNIEYVHGEVEKGKKGIYTGYLYDKKNKKTYIYGDPSTGAMQTENGDVLIEGDNQP